MMIFKGAWSVDVEAAQHLRQEAQRVDRGGQGEPAQGAHRGTLRWRQPGTLIFKQAYS